MSTAAQCKTILDTAPPHQQQNRLDCCGGCETSVFLFIKTAEGGLWNVWTCLCLCGDNKWTFSLWFPPCVHGCWVTMQCSGRTQMTWGMRWKVFFRNSTAPPQKKVTHSKPALAGIMVPSQWASAMWQQMFPSRASLCFPEDPPSFQWGSGLDFILSSADPWALRWHAPWISHGFHPDHCPLPTETTPLHQQTSD